MPGNRISLDNGSKEVNMWNQNSNTYLYLCILVAIYNSKGNNDKEECLVIDDAEVLSTVVRS